MFETGWSGDGIRCIDGLPEGTELWNVRLCGPGQIEVIFSHPSFEPVCECEGPPFLTPGFSREVVS